MVSEDNLRDFVLSFYHVRTQLRQSGFDDKQHLYLMGCLAGPKMEN